MEAMIVSPRTTVTVEWLMKNLNGSVDGYTRRQGSEYVLDWQRLIDRKGQECGEDFVNSILNDGIIDPICIMINSQDEFVQGNGHHRLAIAVLAAMDVIDVVFSFDYDYMQEDITSGGGLAHYDVIVC